MIKELNNTSDFVEDGMKLNELNKMIMESESRMDMIDEILEDGNTEIEADEELDKIYNELGIAPIMNGDIAYIIPDPPNSNIALAANI